MLSIGKINGGREHYYTNEIATAREDYYTAEKLSLEPAGVWLGQGAERVGIAGQPVTREQLRELLRGYTPDGTRALVQNAGKFDGTERDRLPGFDLTFSAPKSVSICWALGSDETRQGIEAAQQNAIRKCVAAYEQHIVIRSGQGGRQQERAGLIVGVVQHVTARATDQATMPDMQLHSHTMVINTGITSSGRSGAVKAYDFYQMQKEYDTLYKAEFGRGLKAMGFALRATKHGFEIEGVPEKVIEHFSKRSKQIEEKAPRENSSAMERMIANLSTREVKGELDEQALQRSWAETALSLGLTRGNVELLRKEKTQYDERAAAQESVREAVNHLTSNTPTFTKEELVQETLKAGVSRGVGKQQAEQQASEFLATQAVVLVQEPPAKEERRADRFTTREKEAEALTEYASHLAKERATVNGLEVLRSEAREAGYKIFAVTAWSEKEAARQTERGLVTCTARRLWQDFARERKEAEAGGKDHLRRERTTWEKLTFKDNSSRHERRIIAAWKTGLGQMSAKTAARYTGDLYQPSSRFQHEFLYATHQITRPERDLMNVLLAREERKVEGKTVVFLGQGVGRRTEDLVEQITARGGRVVLGDAQNFSRGDLREFLHSEEKILDKSAREKAEREIFKARLSRTHKESLAEEERVRTRNR